MRVPDSPVEDLDGIREHLARLSAEKGADAVVESAVDLMDAARAHSRMITMELVRLLRQVVGRRSEKSSDDQLKLYLDHADDDLLVDDELAAQKLEDALAAQSVECAEPEPHPGRNPLPESLEREIVEHVLTEAQRICPCCDKPMRHIGDEVSEVLEHKPARFYVQLHRRAKYACGTCKSGVVTTPAPNKVFERAKVGPALLAGVIVDKYADHLPINRQAARFERESVPIAESTLGGWIGRGVDELEPIVRRLWEQLPQAHVIQTDATSVKVLDRDTEGNIRRGTMWCYVADDKTTLFHYTPTGDGESGPWKVLEGREGYVQADAASVFDRLYDGQKANAIEVGCWAHARRKFFQIHESEPRAAEALAIIGKLYAIEKLATTRKLDADGRRKLRHEHSRPVLRRLRRWLDKTAAREPPRSALAKAIRYVIRQWKALSRFLEDGRLRLDNNQCERQIRSVAIGRKNWLFTGSDKGGHRSAVVYSLLRTCALNAVNPAEYLEHVLTAIAAGWPQSRIDELLPAAYAANR